MQVIYPYQNLSLLDMEGEIWKDVYQMEGYYMVSNMGRVKSLQRITKHSYAGKIRELKGTIIKQSKRKTKSDYYLYFRGSMEGVPYQSPVSRLVYNAFIERLPNFKKKRLIILHKDGDVFNNRVDNLVAVTHQQMSKYYTDKGIISPPPQSFFTPEVKQKIRKILGRSVSQYNMDGTFVRTYDSTSHATEVTGIFHTSIGQVALGRGKSAGGFIWRYRTDGLNLKPEEIIPRRLAKSRSISQYDLEGNFIASYRSIAEAARKVDLNRRQLNDYIGTGKPFGGYLWEDTTKTKTE